MVTFHLSIYTMDHPDISSYNCTKLYGKVPGIFCSRGLLNLGEKAFGSTELGKFNTVEKP